MNIIKDNIALMIIDVQKGFINSKTRHIPFKIKKIFDSYSIKHVIATRFINRQDSPFITLIKWNKLMKDEEIELNEIISLDRIKVFDKYFYSAFTEEVTGYLEKNKIDTLIIVGIDTDICIIKTAADAFERGYTPYVLVDYCMSSAGQENHDAALKILPRLIGDAQVVYGDFANLFRRINSK